MESSEGTIRICTHLGCSVLVFVVILDWLAQGTLVRWFGLIIKEAEHKRKHFKRCVHFRVDIRVARVVGDHHELFDDLLAHQEQFAEGRNRDRAGVGSSEQSLLKEPLIKDDLQTDPILYRCLHKELDDLRRISVDQPCKDQH